MAEDGKGTMMVQATGRVAAPPDVFKISLGVLTEGPTVYEALTENSKRAADVVSALKEHGVAEADLQTSRLGISPVLEVRPPDDPDRTPPRVVAYSVTNTLRANLHDVGRVGDVIDAAAKAGGDAVRVDSLGFSIENTSGLVAEARKQALADVQAKAREICDALSLRLSSIRSVSEAIGTPRLPVFDFALRAEHAAPPTIEAGSEEITVDVSIEYEIAASGS
jgi:hypothetical protein